MSIKVVKFFGEEIDITKEEFNKKVHGILNTIESMTTGNREDIFASMEKYKNIVQSTMLDYESVLKVLEQIAEESLLKYAEMTKDTDPYKTLAELLIKKNEDYGSSSIKNGGLVGNYIRMSDKAERLKNLTGKVNFEALSDTWLDMAGYSVLGIIIIMLTLAKLEES
ncbi:MAG: hypothetical protein ACRCZB_05125 [Bacteroidales bacterium]